MLHANDNTRKTTAALPLAIRLFRQKRTTDLQLLIDYGTVVTVPSWLSAESNLPEASRPLTDRVIEIRPSPDEIVRLSVKDAISARDGYGPITAAELNAPMRARLRFDSKGAITEWRGSDERWHDTAELFRQPKGKRRKSDQERQDDSTRHLAIRGSEGFRNGCSEARCRALGRTIAAYGLHIGCRRWARSMITGAISIVLASVDAIPLTSMAQCRLVPGLQAFQAHHRNWEGG